MSKLKKGLIIAGAVLASLILIVSISLYVFFKSRMPAYEGTITCQKLSEAATVTRDAWGVPHITAKNAKDAYFAYGFTLAQDRLFQMELQRRLARGELAEILGKSLVSVDKQFRTYLFRHTAEKILKHPERINPKALEMMDSFLEGVNHFASTQPLPVEFTLLGLKPRPFTRLDCVSMLGYMAYSFTDGIDTDSLQSILKKKLPGKNVGELFPDYPKTGSTTIMDRQAVYTGGTPAEQASVRDGSGSGGILTTIRSAIAALLGNAPIDGESLAQFYAQIPIFDGSNSWVIAPSRSATGKAILGGDPHIAHSLPGVWYEARVRYGDTDNYGYFLPMYPFPLMAHNDKRAWTITMFENDDLDLYYETFNPDNPDQVRYRGKWVPVTVIKETIKVKGKPDEELQIKVTPHGPVISDFFEEYDGPPVSMFWVFIQEENPLLDVTYNMLNARNMGEFEKALSGLAAPGLNLSWADSDGNIAWWAAGYVPIRSAHVNHQEILDGASGKDEVLGYIPFSKNPKLINPKSGIIVTANNRPTMKPVGGIINVPGYWRPDDRASRITELLSTKEKWSMDDLKKIQVDTYSVAAREVMPVLKTVLEGLAGKKEAMNETGKKALEVLSSWDMRYDVDSAGAVVFHFLMHYILKEGVGDELGDTNFITYCDGPAHWIFIKSFIQNPASEFWNNITTPETETREDIIASAFTKALEDCGKRLGGNPASWEWGEIHRLEYVHPVGMTKPMNLIYNIGPFNAPGEGHLINRIKTHFGKMNFKVSSLPSTRRLIVMGDPDNSYSILPAGNSGNVMSPFYGDQVQMYLAGEYRKLNFSGASIAASKTRVLNLVPAK